MTALNYVIAFLKTPAFMLGIISMIGLIAQRKSASDVIKGTLKVILGFLVLTAGVTVIISGLGALSQMFVAAFNMPGVVPDDNALAAAVQSILSFETAMIMVLAFLVNVVLARITPWKYIFLTGHMMFSFAATMAIILTQLGLSSWSIIILGSLIQGTCQVLFPAVIQPMVRKVTGTNDFAMGFWGSSGIAISAWIGSKLGGKSKSAEKMEISSKFDFIKDMSILMSIVLVITYIIVAIFAGPTTVELAGGNENIASFIIVNALTFVAGILILLQGVRMFIGELVPAFKGFADKIVPNSIPALDIPVFYVYGPISVTVGFIAATIGGLIGIFVTAKFFPVAVLPGVIGLFFCGGAAGVFANKLAGRRAAIISGFTFGLSRSLLIALIWPMVNVALFGVEGLSFAQYDAVLVSGILLLFGMLF